MQSTTCGDDWETSPVACGFCRVLIFLQETVKAVLTVSLAPESTVIDIAFSAFVHERRTLDVALLALS